MKRQMKTVVTLVCVLSLILSFSSFSLADDIKWESWVDEEAEWAASHPQLNESLTWSLDEETGTLTIGGEGWMNTTGVWGANPAPWFDEFREKEIDENGVTQLSENAGFSSVVISDGIKNVGNCAFFSCGGLQEVLLPDSILYIGNCAFDYCIDLKTITLQEGIEYIFNYGFEGCGFENIILPASLKMVLDEAFAYCIELKEIVIPSQVEYLGEQAFAYCSKLESVTLPKSLTTLGENVFVECSALTNINYEGSEDEWLQLLGTEREDMDVFSSVTVHYNSAIPSPKSLRVRQEVEKAIRAVLSEGINVEDPVYWEEMELITLVFEKMFDEDSMASMSYSKIRSIVSEKAALAIEQLKLMKTAADLHQQLIDNEFWSALLNGAAEANAG